MQYKRFKHIIVFTIIIFKDEITNVFGQIILTETW